DLVCSHLPTHSSEHPFRHGSRPHTVQQPLFSSASGPYSSSPFTAGMLPAFPSVRAGTASFCSPWLHAPVSILHQQIFLPVNVLQFLRIRLNDPQAVPMSP